MAALTIVLTVNAASARADCLTVVASPNEVAESVIPSFRAKLAEHDICMEFQFAPPKRASVMLKSAHIDGEFLRTPEYLNTVKNSAFMITEPVLEGFGLLITHETGPQSLDDLKGKSIGVRLGFKWQERVLMGHDKQVYVDSYETGFAMLANNYIEGLLIDNLNYLKLQADYAGLQSTQVTPKNAVYLFLHNKHAHMERDVHRAIADWRQNFFRTVTN